MFNRLQALYPNRVLKPVNVNDIPTDGYMVYILTFNNKPIVLGHGKKNRSRVIFDDKDQITKYHIKALFVRLYNLFGDGNFHKYIIKCSSKEEAKEIENNLHREVGGNTRHIPAEIRSQLFANLNVNSVPYLLLEIALRSSYDGLSDLRKWRSDGIINDEIWAEISERLKLN